LTQRGRAATLTERSGGRILTARTPRETGVAMMTDNKGLPRPDDDSADEQDVEGHNMWISSGMSSDLAYSRSKELEKEARERKRAKEAKAADRASVAEVPPTREDHGGTRSVDRRHDLVITLRAARLDHGGHAG